MKKLLSILLAVMVASLCVFAAFADEPAGEPAADAPAGVSDEGGEQTGEELEYVSFFALGNDPYATFAFSKDGKNDEIDPDTVTWAAIRYRTVTKEDNNGNPLTGQFYISPAAEPFVPIVWNHTEKWETVIVDMTSVREGTELVSKWNSSSYTSTTTIRFDPMESLRDAEAAQNELDDNIVLEDSEIDIAWIAFFETKEEAEAFDGKDMTEPYCVLTVLELEEPASDNHNLEPMLVDNHPEKPTEVPTEEPTPTQAAEEPTAEATEEPEIEPAAEPTEAPKVDPTPAPGKKKGCGGFAAGMCVIPLMLAAAAVFMKKH